MKYNIPKPPFWLFIFINILLFLFVILPGINSFNIAVLILFITIEIITLGNGIANILYRKKTKKLFYILWEVEFFLYILILIILSPEEALSVEEVSPITIITCSLGLIAIEVFFLIYVIFKEKAITKLLFILASSTTVVVFLIVFFVFMEGLPAFTENDPVEFITTTTFDPFYKDDVIQSVTVDTTIKYTDFSINTEKQKIYIPPYSKHNGSLEISNYGEIADNFSIQLKSDLRIILDKKYTKVEPYQSSVINFTIETQETGEYLIESIVESNSTGKQKTLDIKCILSNQGVSVTPDSQIYFLKGEVENIAVPYKITHFGKNNETYTIKIESSERFIPFVYEIPWDYTNSSGEINLQPYEQINLTIYPRFIRKIEGIYTLNITAFSHNNSNIYDEVKLIIDYTKNSLVTVDESEKQISSNGTAIYFVDFSDDVIGKKIDISINFLQGNADIKILHNNLSIFSGEGKFEYTFDESQATFLLFTVKPNQNSGELVTTKIDVRMPGTKPTLGALAFIAGTILTTIIAIMIAAPIGISVAILLAEFAPSKIRSFLKPLYELLAGIPSVIYGLWGFLALGPLLRENIYPYITGTIGKVIPLFEETNSMGRDVFTASIVLSIMILPIIITLSEDSIRSVSKSLKEGSLALGATRWQTMKNIVIPKAKSGVVSSIILGTGRAIGETMAVLMIMGGSINLPDSIFEPAMTMTGVIATFFETMFKFDLSRHALFAIGMILFLMVFCLNIIIASIIKSDEPKKTKISTRNKIWQKIKLKKKENPNKKNQIVINNYKFKKYDFVPKNNYSSIKQALLKEKIVIVLLIVAACIASFFIIYILADVFVNGGLSLKPEYFFEIERGAGREGGFLNAITGSIYLICIALLIAAPLSIGAAIYVHEYAKSNSLITKIILFTSDTLASTPSIIFGAFGFMLFVLYLDFGYSLIAGGLTLGFMIIPIMLRSSIESIKAIPREFQEGALALGVTKWKSITTVVLPPATPGIVSGVIISLGRAIGETAAVLLTAGYATHIPGSPLHSAASMPNLIYKNYGQTALIPELGEKVYSAAFVLIIIVLILNAVARLISYRGSKMMKE